MSYNGLVNGYQSLLNLTTFDDASVMNASYMTAYDNLSLPYINPNDILVTDTNSNVIGKTLTNGQILIGNSGSSPVANTLTGTTNQVNVSGGAGTITLSTPQDISTTSNVIFNQLTSNSINNAGTVTCGNLIDSGLTATTLTSTNGLKQLQSVTIANTNGSNTSFSGSTLTCSNTQDLRTSATPTFANIIDSGLTATRLLASNASKQLQSISILNANGCNISFGGSSLACTMIQDVSTTGTPTFANLIDSGLTATTLLASDASKQLQSISITNANGCNTSFSGSTLACTMTQDLTTSGTPNFSSLTLDSVSNQLVLGAYGSNITLSASAPSTSLVYTIPDTLINSQFVMNQGVQTINSSKLFSSALQISPTTNQLILGGNLGVFKVTVNAPTPASASLTHTIPDVGTNANFVMTEGSQTVNGDKTFNNNVFVNGSLNAKGSLFYTSAITTAYTASATILESDLLSMFFQFTTNVAGVVLTFPTGTAIETALSAITTPFNGLSFDVLFWNYNTNGVTLAPSAGVNFQIMNTVQPGSTARLYRMIRTALNTYYIYNLS